MVFVRASSEEERRALKQGVRREVGRVSERMPAVEFVAFLEQFVVAYPTPPLYLVLDNASTHTAKLTRAWLAVHPQVTLYFLPS